MKFNDSGLGPVYIMWEQRAENSAQTAFSKITAKSKGSDFRYGLIKAQVMSSDYFCPDVLALLLYQPFSQSFPLALLTATT